MVNNCPFRRFLFDNILKGGSGEYRCLARTRQPEDVNLKNYDYPACDQDNHEYCPVYGRGKELKLSV